MHKSGKLSNVDLTALVAEKGVRGAARELGVNPGSVSRAYYRQRQKCLYHQEQPAQALTIAAATKKLSRKLDLLQEIRGDHGKLAEALRYVESRLEAADEQLRPVLEARFLRMLEAKGKVEDRFLETGRTFLSLIAEEEFRRILLQEIKAESPDVAKRVKKRIDSLLAAQGIL